MRPFGADDGDASDPRHVGNEIRQKDVALLALGDHRDVAARQHLDEGANRIDHLALRVCAAPRQIDGLGVGLLDVFEARDFEPVHPLEHQRHDRDQGEHDEAGADAEDRLVPARCLVRFCAIGGHRLSPARAGT